MFGFDTGLADVPAEFGFTQVFLTDLQECEENSLLCFSALVFHFEWWKIGLNYYVHENSSFGCILGLSCSTITVTLLIDKLSWSEELNNMRVFSYSLKPLPFFLQLHSFVLLPPWPKGIVESITLHVDHIIPSVHIKVQEGGKPSYSGTIYLRLSFPHSCLFPYI